MVNMKIEEIKTLYDQIHTCNKCFQIEDCKMTYDKDRKLRRMVEKALESDVFVVGQSLGGKTQRLSGLPYFKPGDNKPSPTGEALDRFLRSFGYTINPSNDLKYVYSSDIVQCYPSKAEGGDRKPTASEVENCSVWLDEELRLVEPEIVVLLGRIAAKHFLNKYLNCDIPKKQEIWGQEYQYTQREKRIAVFPIQHPAYARYARRKPESVCQVYEKTAKRIQEILTAGQGI